MTELVPSNGTATIGLRFWAKVDRRGDDECWPWTAATMARGYGKIYVDGKLVGAHRVAYELTKGPIPEGMVIDHLCRNTACVNPDHLEAVSQRENLLRGETVVAKAAQQTACIHGHNFSDENTYMHNGQRHCRTCRREYSAWYERNVRVRR